MGPRAVWNILLRALRNKFAKAVHLWSSYFAWNCTKSSNAILLVSRMKIYEAEWSRSLHSVVAGRIRTWVVLFAWFQSFHCSLLPKNSLVVFLVLQKIQSIVWNLQRHLPNPFGPSICLQTPPPAHSRFEKKNAHKILVSRSRGIILAIILVSKRFAIMFACDRPLFW